MRYSRGLLFAVNRIYFLPRNIRIEIMFMLSSHLNCTKENSTRGTVFTSHVGSRDGSLIFEEEHADINLVAAVKYSAVVNEPARSDPGVKRAVGACARAACRLLPSVPPAAMYFGRDPNNGRLAYNLSWANRQNNTDLTSDSFAIIIIYRNCIRCSPIPTIALHHIDS